MGRPGDTAGPVDLRHLRGTLKAILDRPPDPASLNSFVGVCHALAVAGLAVKRTTGTLMDFHDLSLSDLAYDTLADLFQRDEDGKLYQIQAYFEGIEIAATPEDDLLIHLRRLVLSRVNQGIFRLYHEIDPTLGKILRNVKLAVQALGHYEEVERFGEICFAPGLCDRLEHLKIPDRSILEVELSPYVRGTERIPELLGKLSWYLRNQSAHARIVPLMTIALVFRALYSRTQEPLEREHEPSDALGSADTTMQIKRACSAIRSRYAPVYLESRKVNDPVWRVYFEVIEESLLARFVAEDGNEFTLLGGMQVRMPELTREDYKQHHRAKLEHLHRLTEQRFLGQMKS